MYILEQAAAAFVFSCRLEKRSPLWIRNLASAALLLLFGLYTDRTSYGRAREAGASSYSVLHAFLFSVLIIGVILLLVMFTRRVTLTEALYAVTCAYLTEHIAYCIRILCSHAAGPGAADSPARALYWIIHGAVYLAAYFLFAKKMIHRGHYIAAPLRTIVLLVYAISIILVASMYATMYSFEPLHAFYALAFSLFALLAQMDRQRQLSEREESAVREQLMIAQREQYDLYRQNVSTVDRRCHDLRHQAGHLLKSAASDEQKEEIRSLMKDIMIYDSFVKTGCRDLDTILTQKNEICRRKGIELTCVADGKKLSFMDGADLFALFDRLFDRAISQAESLPEKERRISFTVSEKFGLTAAAVEYPSPQKPVSRTEEERFLRPLELVLEKYDGSVRASEEDGTRYVRIVLQAPEKD